MAEAKPLIIGDWYKGMGLTAHTGPELIKCLNIDDYGILKLNNKPEAMGVDTGSPLGGLVTWIGPGRVSATAKINFAIMNGAMKYYSASSSEWENMAASYYPDGKGAVTFGGSNASKDYLLFTNAADLRALDLSTYNTSPAVTVIASTLESSITYRPMTLALNNAAYIGNGRYIAELIEIDGQTFAPGTGTTFTFTPKKFGIPADAQVSALGQMGSYLVAGTTNGDLYFWNMETVTDDSPFPERKVEGADGIVNIIKVYKNVIYYQAGNKGIWYYTTGITSQKCAQIPQQISGEYAVVIKPNSATVQNDKIYFGAGIGAYSGIWSFDTQKVGQSVDPTDLGVQACIYEHRVSTDYVSVNIEIGGMLGTGATASIASGTSSQLIYGMSQEGDTDYYRIDKTSAYVYSSSEGEYISQFYQVGTRRNKRTFKSVEMQLAEPLANNYSVTLYYRESTAASWSALATFSTAGDSSYVANRSITVDKIQIKAVVDGAATSKTNIKILSFILS